MPEIKAGAEIALRRENGNLFVDNTQVPQGELIRFEPDAVLYSGTVTSGAIRTITDSSADWLEGELIGQALRVGRNGSHWEYGYIVANSQKTVTVEYDLEFTPDALDEYQILETLELEEDDLTCTVFADLTSAPGVVVLPEITEAMYGQSVSVYLINYDGTNKLGVITRGQDLQAGGKWGTLEHKNEGVRLQVEGPLQWIVAQIFFIKRYCFGYLESPESVSSASFVPHGAAVDVDMNKRFVEYHVSGITWFRYTALLPYTFMVDFVAVIEKSGGAGEIEITIAKRTDAGVITYLTDRVSITRFGSGSGYATIAVSAPVSLTFGDSIAMAARNAGGTFNLLEGSSLKIYEV
jgi:hypothetical protein